MVGDTVAVGVKVGVSKVGVIVRLAVAVNVVVWVALEVGEEVCVPVACWRSISGAI